MLPSHVELPGIYKTINASGTYLENLGVLSTPMDFHSLCNLAERKTGLHDFGDPFFEEGLKVLLISIRDDARLHFFGKFITRMIILNYLTQRLLFYNAQKISPETFKSKLQAPFIVTGIPRSGTTFLHRMLSLDSRNDGIPFWRLYRPFPFLNKRDSREISAKWELKIRRPIYPELDSKHFTREDQLDECIWMMGLTFHAITFWVLAPVSSFAQWLFKQDRYKYYQEYELLLKAQQNYIPGSSLVLKAPDHTPNLDTILSLIPNARILQLHRDPAKCMISLSSLFYSTQCSLTNEINPKIIAEINKEMYTYYLQANKKIRKDPSVNRSVLDIRYEDLTTEPIETVKKIYDRFDVPYSTGFEDKLVNYISQHPKNKHGRHQYSPEQFGLSYQELNDHFSSLT